MPGRSHSRQFELECVRQVAAGHKRPAQLCREHDLSESVLLRWRKEYEARGEEAFTEKQPSSHEEALEARIAERWSVFAASSPWRTRS
jgi:transposase